MDETRGRLARCFLAVFPALSESQVFTADIGNTEGWDSVASVTLLATVEEEFEIQIELQDAGALLSFTGFLDYLIARVARGEG